ncbi:MAG: hypothetical protein AAGU05_16860, partial [Anaerolineaceae bacterium]
AVDGRNYFTHPQGLFHLGQTVPALKRFRFSGLQNPTKFPAVGIMPLVENFLFPFFPNQSSPSTR